MPEKTTMTMITMMMMIVVVVVMMMITMTTTITMTMMIQEVVEERPTDIYSAIEAANDKYDIVEKFGNIFLRPKKMKGS